MSDRSSFETTWGRANYAAVNNLSVPECALFSHLIEVLCFFLRQYLNRSRFFLLTDNVAARVAQLMSCPEKYLQLSACIPSHHLMCQHLLIHSTGALKYFRACIGLHDESYERHLIHHQLFEPILNLLFQTMPRDNLLNSACLELFEFIRRENRVELINHVVETYRDKLAPITYVDTFQNLILRYDQLHEPQKDADASFTSDAGSEPGLPPGRMGLVNGGRWQGLRESDAEEEAYFNSSDNEDDDIDPLSTIAVGHPAGSKENRVTNVTNGVHPARPLVDYPDDDEEDDIDALAMSEDATSTDEQQAQEQTQQDDASDSHPETPITTSTPSTPLPELKRRRDEDEEEDELSKLSSSTKRRSSSFSSVKSDASTKSSHNNSNNNDSNGGSTVGAGGPLRRKKSINSGKDGGGAGPKKIAISLAVKSAEGKAEGDGSE